MAVEIKMPQLGLTMTEGTVGAWLKQVGDTVAKGEPILEITTDKLTSEIESEVDGVLLAVSAQEGDDVPVQGVLGYIGQAGEQVAASPAQEDAPAAETASPTQTVSSARPSGAASAAEGSAPEGSAPDAVADSARQTETAGPSAAASAAGGRIKISPLAKKTAAKLCVDYSRVLGSGPAGRILQRDILEEAEKPEGTACTATAQAAEAVRSASAVMAEAEASGGIALMEGDVVTKLTGMRKVVAERMSQSRREIPSVTQNVKIDVTSLLKLRRELNAGRETRFSVNDFVLKAVAKALRRNPHMLVSLDGDRIIKRAHVNLGMAVAVEDGLIVPVIKDADKLGLEALASAAKELASKAREGRLIMDEYKGSTFTVSNLGMFGVETFDPIINQPDAAILGVCAISPELALDGAGNVTEKQVMRISLTFDHRLIDGAAAAQFELEIKGLLEDPMSIIL